MLNEEVETILVPLLRSAKRVGLKLCLWTLPFSDNDLQWKIEWCDKHGIKMDFINSSPLEIEDSKKFGKPFFNLLLDDHAGLEETYRILWNLITWIETC